MDPWLYFALHAHSQESIFQTIGKADLLRTVCLSIHLQCVSADAVLRKQLIRTFIMDGNFSAEHMRCRTADADVPLSAGMAFMADPDSYKTHLQSGKEISQVCRQSLNE